VELEERAEGCRGHQIEKAGGIEKLRECGGEEPTLQIYIDSFRRPYGFSCELDCGLDKDCPVYLSGGGF